MQCGIFDDDINPDDLPGLLACHGVPQPMNTAPQRSCWGIGTESTELRPKPPHVEHHTQQLEQTHGQYHGFNARRVVEDFTDAKV